MNEHRYIDEAGDTTFYGKGGKVIIGEEGVSMSFIIGMLKIQEDKETLLAKIKAKEHSIITHALYKTIPSVINRTSKGNFFFHAKDDHPEIRAKYFEFIETVDCSFQAVVGRKEITRYETQHHADETEFYADILSHLIKDKLQQEGKLILNIASRHNSTSYNNLQKALNIATQRFLKTKRPDNLLRTVNFNVQPYTSEPILSIADYFCWAVQRVFEKGETRFYNFLSPKISLVVDLWDTERYMKSGNYYRGKNMLTEEQKIKKPSLL